MNTTQISVTQGDCILSVSHSKRTVSLLRTGEKGEILKQKHQSLNGDWQSAFNLSAGSDVPKSIGNYNSNGNSRIERSNKPEFERGWSKMEKVSVSTLKINTLKLDLKPSVSTLRELAMPKKMDFNQLLIAAIHDIAYEIARNGGSHCIAWKLQNIATGDSLAAESKWENGKIAFTLKFHYYGE